MSIPPEYASAVVVSSAFLTLLKLFYLDCTLIYGKIPIIYFNDTKIEPCVFTKKWVNL